MSLQIILQARHVSYCGPWPWQICAHVGNSLMLSGESGHNISAEEHSRQFLLSNQGQRPRMRPRWQEASAWTNDSYRVRVPGTICEQRKQWGLSTEVKIYFGYLLRLQLTAWVYLFDTSVLATGETIYLATDNTWRHSESRREASAGWQPHTSDWAAH